MLLENIFYILKEKVNNIYYNFVFLLLKTNLSLHCFKNSDLNEIFLNYDLVFKVFRLDAVQISGDKYQNCSGIGEEFVFWNICSMKRREYPKKVFGMILYCMYWVCKRKSNKVNISVDVVHLRKISSIYKVIVLIRWTKEDQKYLFIQMGK